MAQPRDMNATALGEVIDALALRLHDLEVAVPENQHSLSEAANSIWLFISVAELVTMHIGFAMREAGLVRERSMVTTYAKNLLGMAQNAMMCLLVTFNIAYPKEDMYLLLMDTMETDHRLRKRIAFHMMAQTMVCSIISGAMAERTTVAGAFILNSFVAVLQAVVVRETWGGGFLSEMSTPFFDSSGAGVVHMVGGTIAMVGALIVGSRRGRWNEEEKGSFVPHSLSMTTSGVMLIWCGWYGYLFVSQDMITTMASSNAVSLGAVNTTISSSISGLLAVLYALAKSKGETINMIGMCNSILAGLVAMCGIHDAVDLKWAPLIGSVAAILVIAKAHIFKFFHIDDVSDACAVHGVCGAWGVIAAGLFHHSDGLVVNGSSDLFFAQLFGGLAIFGYAAMAGAMLLGLLRCCNMLRVSNTVEVSGLDVTLGFEAYHKNTAEMNALRQAGGVLERCSHRPGEVVGALVNLKRIINRPFTPHAAEKKRQGEVNDILEQLEPKEFDPTLHHFIVLVHDKHDGAAAAQAFEHAATELLLNHYHHVPRTGHLGSHHALVHIHSNDITDPKHRMEIIDNAQNVVILLTKKIFTLPWSIAEIVHASAASKRLLCIHVEFEDPENDKRAFKFPDDVDRVTLKWQELVDETGEEVAVMNTPGGSTKKRSRRRGRNTSETSAASHQSSSSTVHKASSSGWSGVHKAPSSLSQTSADSRPRTSTARSSASSNSSGED